MTSRIFLRRSLPAGALSMLLLLGAGCKRPATSTENTAAANQPASAAAADQQIANAVQTKINAEPALNGQNIQVSVANGVVTLSGAANDDASRALAGNESGAVDGVKTVVNNLTVTPPKPVQAAAPPRRAPVVRERAARAEKARVAPPAPPAAAPQETVRTVPPPPAAPAQPVSQTVTVQSGSVIPVRMTDSLDSATTQSGATFRGSLANDLVVNGMVAAPQGSTILGRVIEAKDAGHFSGNSELTIELTRIDVRGQQIAIVTNSYSKEGKGRGKNTAVKTGAGAAIGSIIGALAGGGKGAAIGAVAGGGLGAGVNGVTRGEQVKIPSESLINFRLQSPFTITTTHRAGGTRSFDSAPPPQLQDRPQD